MKQRIVVQAIIEDNSKVLLLRRSQGRPAIVGKYELPGGTLNDDEQPDDGLRRHLRNDTGLTPTSLKISDAISIINREEGDIQHVLIAYIAYGVDERTPVNVGSNYDMYEWKHRSELQQSFLRDSAATLLGFYDELEKHQFVELDNRDDRDNDVLNTINQHKIVIYSDGGSRGNPGPSAAAFVIMNDRQDVLEQGGTYLGITTNNQAEYHGVRLGLERAIELGIESVEVRIDSMLVVNQLRGFYKIKNRELWPINERITALVGKFRHVAFKHVPRDLNQLADSLVNKLLDEHKNDID